MTVGIVKTVSTGHPGGTGLTVMAFNWTGTAQTADVLTAVRNFWVSVAGDMPPSVSMQVQKVVDLHDEITGELIGEDVVNTPTYAPVPGTSTVNSWAAGVGAAITWSTSGIRNSRRVKGKTYIVPLQTGAYANDGTLYTSVDTRLAGAGTGLISAAATAGAPFSVWTRPHTSSEEDPRPSYPGLLSEVIAASVKDQVAGLRGRRS